MTAAATSPSSDASGAPHYRVQFIDLEGNVVRTERLLAATDDEALALASTMTNGHAVELWDGLRFLEHFDATSPHF
ncbi:hypothetical protein [Methylobacterium sp. CM6257]